MTIIGLMRILCLLLTIFVQKNTSQQEYPGTPNYLEPIGAIKNVGFFDDAQHRGKKWYPDTESDYKTGDESSSTSDTSSSLSSLENPTESKSSEASSHETREVISVTRQYRTCKSCPHDMLKNWKNRGIKWVCAGYQRARRSFKSTCMMRYRNCQDGTMFVKIHDHRCKNDSFHGKHWFYVYKV